MKFRHEYKYQISYHDFLVIRSRLNAIASRDLHVDESGIYEIRSLYFDDFQNTALYEKLDGVNMREKFRIRLYNGDTDFIRLEKKSKINGLCNKVQCKLSADEVRKIQDGDIEWMQNADRPLVVELYEKMKSTGLKPKVLVNYLREPFVYVPGNVRITFDYDIRSGMYNCDFLDMSTPLVPTTNDYIMEVKFDEFLPANIQDIIQSNRTCGAFSKYAICRMYG